MFWKIPRIPSICPCLLVSPFSWLAQEINLQCLMVNTCPFPWKLGAVRGWVSHHSYRAYTPTDGSYTWFEPLWSIFAATIHHYQPLWTIVLTHDIPMFSIYFCLNCTPQGPISWGFSPLDGTSSSMVRGGLRGKSLNRTVRGTWSFSTSRLSRFGKIGPQVKYT